MPKPEDPVRTFLTERGCPDDVVAGGLEGLVGAWERTVRQVEQGYPLGLDDYLNDLDGRQLLEEALEVATPPARGAVLERVEESDAHMRQRVRLMGECLWGARVAASEGWTPAANWWYFAVPQKPGPELAADLESPE